MSTFHADFYDLYRPLYPAATYAGLSAPVVALDLGAGTGQSAESLVRVLAPFELHVLDPDALMLERARARLGRLSQPGGDVSEFSVSKHVFHSTDTRFHHAPAEAIPLPDASVDLVTIASAFHWMDRARVREECKRVLRPGGHLLVYEYQFPKCGALPELNEWIRRQFNQLWKAPGQVPRGNFRDAVLAPLRGDPALRVISEGPVSMRLLLTPDELYGLILSQSRYLHYERTLAARRNEGLEDGGSAAEGRSVAAERSLGDVRDTLGANAAASAAGISTPIVAVARERARILAEISIRMPGVVRPASVADSGGTNGASAGAEFDFALARALFVRA